jgi:hypothetical protein
MVERMIWNSDGAAYDGGGCSAEPLALESNQSSPEEVSVET